MKKILIILLCVFTLSSCSKQNKKVEEPVQETQKPNLERKSVLEEFLSETSSENEGKSKLVFGKDPVPLSYYTDDGYVAHVCVEHAEIKKEPDFNSETVRTIDYGDGFYVRQCWYAKEGDGFWCSYGANENNEIEWIFSKNLNLDTGINISKLETDGEIMEQGPKYHLLSGITKRYGYLVKDNEWNFPLEENEKHELFFESTRDYDRGSCFDPIGIFKFDKLSNALIPINYTVYSPEYGGI